jgi:hypothetical protein
MRSGPMHRPTSIGRVFSSYIFTRTLKYERKGVLTTIIFVFSPLRITLLLRFALGA